MFSLARSPVIRMGRRRRSVPGARRSAPTRGGSVSASSTRAPPTPGGPTPRAQRRSAAARRPWRSSGTRSRIPLPRRSATGRLPPAGWRDWWAVTAAAATIATIEAVIGSPVRERDVEPMTWALVERGRATSAVEFVQRRDELGALARFAAAWWGEGFDLLLTPTVQAPAPALGELMEGDPATLLQRQLGWFPLTPFANVSGQPAISVPVDSGVDALPVDVQLIAGLGREDVLMRVAAQVERAMPWRGVAPAFALR